VRWIVSDCGASRHSAATERQKDGGSENHFALHHFAKRILFDRCDPPDLHFMTVMPPVISFCENPLGPQIQKTRRLSVSEKKSAGFLNLWEITNLMTGSTNANPSQMGRE